MLYFATSALALLFCAFCGAQSEEPDQILRRAVSLHQAGEIDAAIQAYGEYLIIQPDSLMALSILGVAYARAGRYEEAIAQYQRGLQLQPGNGPVQFNLECSGEAVAYYKTGDAEHAAAVGNGYRERALVRMLNAESDAKQLGAAGK